MANERYFMNLERLEVSIHIAEAKDIHRITVVILKWAFHGTWYQSELLVLPRNPVLDSRMNIPSLHIKNILIHCLNQNHIVNLLIV